MSKFEEMIKDNNSNLSKLELIGAIGTISHSLAIILGIEEQEIREMYCIDYEANETVLRSKLINLYQLILELRKFKNENCIL